MARLAKPLSDTEIKNAKPKDKEYNLADGSGLQSELNQMARNSGCLTTHTQ